MIEFETRHTKESLRRAYAEWWRRVYSRAYRVSFVIAVAAFLAMLLLGSASWPLVVVATLAAAYAGFLVAFRETAIGLAHRYLEIIGEGPLRYRLDDSGIREASRLGECDLRWFVFDSLVRQSDALILVKKPRDSQTFIIFPLDQIPAGLQEFIEARLRATSGSSDSLK